MKKNIHPKQQKVTVIMSNGSTYTTHFTFLKHKKHSVLLDIDSANHPSFNKQLNKRLIKYNTRLTKFRKRFNKTKLTKI